MGNRYTDEFFSLTCCGDVLNVVSPISGSKPTKEISEAMGARRVIKDMALKRCKGGELKDGYDLLDLCAGNALTSVLSVFTLPIREAVAIDKREVKRRWHLAKRFTYLNVDIKGKIRCKHPTIIVGVHACKDLAERVIEIYLENELAEHLVLMPCCVGSENFSGQYRTRYRDLQLTRYEHWCWHLAKMCDGEFKKDPFVMSPANIIITASKPGCRYVL